jgi:hypothetical protein
MSDTATVFGGGANKVVSNSSLSRTTFRNVAIPNEHGGWMFLLEPALIGLGIGFTLPGMLLAMAALGAFLTRHPLKLMLDDRLKSRLIPRTKWAVRFSLLYGGLAAVMFATCLLTAQRPFLLPLILAAPLATIQIYQDAYRRSRELAAELSGSIAMGGLAMAVLLLAGWNPLLAAMVWVIVACRAVTVILYIRARLRLEHGKAISTMSVWASHLVSLALLGGLAYFRLVPWLTVVVALIWLGRAFIGLSRFRKPTRAPTIGIQETVLGLLTVAIVVAGYRLFF